MLSEILADIVVFTVYAIGYIVLAGAVLSPVLIGWSLWALFLKKQKSEK